MINTLSLLDLDVDGLAGRRGDTGVAVTLLLLLLRFGLNNWRDGVPGVPFGLDGSEIIGMLANLLNMYALVSHVTKF